MTRHWDGYEVTDAEAAYDPYEHWLRAFPGSRDQILAIDPAILEASESLEARTWQMVRQVWDPKPPWIWPRPYQWRVSPDVRRSLWEFLNALDPTYEADAAEHFLGDDDALIYWRLHVIADPGLPPNSIILEAIS